MSGYTSSSAVGQAELFPTQVRALGVGLPCALTTAVFGGTGELPGAFAQAQGHAEVFHWYVTARAARSLLVYWRMGEPRARGHV